MSDLVTSSGQRLTLGRAIGKGAEGTIYELAHDPSVVAKVYHHPLSQDRAEKLAAMVRLRTQELSELTAWPRDVIYSGPNKPVGLTMAKVANGKDVHNLYGPKSRLQDFPRADWRFLVRTAKNIATAFAILQDAGIVVGDVNHGSILVADDATVKLIDCDSFQIVTSNRRFLCEVGVETFTPPELQGVAFKDVAQTTNHDSFRLAVMAFHLLFLGRHPFAGRYLGTGEMPLGRAIKEFRFAYSVTNRAMQMDRPPGTPPLDLVGKQLAGMFELAFSQSSVAQGRPAPRDWIASLTDLEKLLARCANNHGHWYSGHLGKCPWCEMEGLGANALFPYVLPPGTRIDIDSLWKQLSALPRLGPSPLLSTTSPAPSREARAVGPPRSLPEFIPIVSGWAVFIVATIYILPLFWLWAIAGWAVSTTVARIGKGTDRTGPFKLRFEEARRALDAALPDWNLRTSGASLVQSMEQFEVVRSSLSGLPAQRLRRLDQLRQDKRRLQLNHFLDRFRIEDAKVPGIGPAKKGVLVSYGVETAEDVAQHQIEQIPGFGPKTAAKLVSWRTTLERRFVFDASKAVDPNDIARVEQQILIERTKLEAAAKALHAEAMQRHSQVSTARQTLRQQMDKLQAVADQALADLRHVEGSV